MHYELDKTLKEDLINSGLFKSTGLSHLLRLLKTKDDKEYFYHMGDKIWLEFMTIAGISYYQKIKFETMLEELDPEIKEKLIYYLDIFVAS